MNSTHGILGTLVILLKARKKPAQFEFKIDLKIMQSNCSLEETLFSKKTMMLLKYIKLLFI